MSISSIQKVTKRIRWRCLTPAGLSSAARLILKSIRAGKLNGEMTRPADNRAKPHTLDHRGMGLKRYLHENGCAK